MEQGCPVNLRTGHATTLPVRDFALQGAFGDDIVFERIYDSGRPHDAAAQPKPPSSSASEFDSYLGAGWVHSFQSRLVQVSGHVIYYRDDGRSLDFKWNAAKNAYDRPPGRPLSLVAATGGGFQLQDLVTGETWLFNAAGRLTRRATRAGKGINLAYDGAGHLVGVSNDSAQKIKLSYNPTSHLLESIALDFASNSLLVQFGYDGTQRLNTVSYPQGAGYFFTNAGPGGRLNNVKQGGRNVEIFTYKADGRVETAKSADSALSFTYDYDCDPDPDPKKVVKGTRVVDGQAQLESCVVFDPFTALPIRIYGESAQTDVTLTVFDQRGLPRTVIDRAGIPRQYEYDNEGRLIYEDIGNWTVDKQNSDLRPRRKYEYPPCGGGAPCFQPSFIYEQGALSEAKKLYCDPKKSTANCKKTSITYWPDNWKVKSIQIEGLTRSVTPSDLPFCYIQEWTYTSGGRVSKVTQPRRCLTTAFDFTEFKYHPPGLPNGERVQQVIDQSLLLSLVRTSISVYDSFGRPKNATLGGVSHSWEYDDRGLVLQTAYGSPPRVTKYFYSDGRLRSVQHPAGNFEHYTYQPTPGAFSRLTHLTRTGTAPGAGSAPPSGSEAIEFQNDPIVGLPWRVLYYRKGAYDRQRRWTFSKGRVSEMQLAEVSPPKAYQKFGYDGAGRLETIENNFYPTPSSKTTFKYDDPQGRLSSVTQKGGTTETTWAYLRDKVGNVVASTDPSGRETAYVYDDLDRLVMVSSPNSPEIGRTRLEYDPAGRVVVRVEGDGGPGKRTIVYIYDFIGRLKVESAGGKFVGYEYDKDPAFPGKLSKVTDQYASTEFLYNGYGELAAEKKTFSQFYPGATVSIEYKYNANGTPDTTTVKEGDDKNREWVVNYYNSLGSGAEWDPDRPTRVTLASPGEKWPALLASGISWRSFLNEVKELTYGNGRRTAKVYELNGYLDTEEWWEAQKTTPLSWHYLPDWSGRPLLAQTYVGTSKDESLIGRKYNELTYDVHERLAFSDSANEYKVKCPAGLCFPTTRAIVNYTYDLSGNRDVVTNNSTKYDTYCYESPAACGEAKSATSNRLCRVIRGATQPGGCSAAADASGALAPVTTSEVASTSSTKVKAKWQNKDLEDDWNKLLDTVANILKGPVTPGLEGRIKAVQRVVEAFLRKHGIPSPVFARALLSLPSVRSGLGKLLGSNPSNPSSAQAAMQSLATAAGSTAIGPALAPYAAGMATDYKWDSAGRLVSEGPDLCYLYDDWGRLATLGTRKDRKLSCEKSNVWPVAEYHYDYLGRKVVKRRFGVIGLERPNAYFHDQWNQLIAIGYPDEDVKKVIITNLFVYLAGQPLAQVSVGDLVMDVDTSGCTGCVVAAMPRGPIVGFCILLVIPLAAALVRSLRRGRRRKAAGLGAAILLVASLPLLLMINCVAVGTPKSKPTIYYYHNDPLGLPIMLTDEKGMMKWQATYDDFGAVVEEYGDPLVGTPIRFPGQLDEDDKTVVGGKGPYYNWNRFYDPETGRYMTPDPMLVTGEDANPAFRRMPHPYTYADNDPINGVDPTGLFVFLSPSCIVAENQFGQWVPAAAKLFGLLGKLQSRLRRCGPMKPPERKHLHNILFGRKPYMFECKSWGTLDAVVMPDGRHLMRIAETDPIFPFIATFNVDRMERWTPGAVAHEILHFAPPGEEEMFYPKKYDRDPSSGQLKSRIDACCR